MRLGQALPRFFDPTAWAAILQADEAIRTETASYTAQLWDHTILCDATAGPVTVTLPPAELARGKVLVVKKIDASANAVVIDPYAAETVDGAATVSTTTRWAGWMVQSSGTAWHILAT